MSDLIKVKLIKSIVYEDGVWPMGYVLYVTPDYAAELVAEGKVEIVSAETPKAAKPTKETK